MNGPHGYLKDCLPSGKSESEVRARRALMEASMRAEGTPEPMIERLATDDTAERMLTYEKRTIDFIANLFGAP